MRLAIRDDDTNFFTSPGELQACYSEIWDELPPTLCVITKVKGAWNEWVHRIYREKQGTNWDAWTADNTAHPIEHNEELVRFLAVKVAEGKLDIGYHAKYHRNEDPVAPEQKDNNYVRGAEYYTSRDLKGDIIAECALLEKLFGKKVTVFTPPQNLLSPKGYEAVTRAGLNICGGGIPFYQKEKTIAGLLNIGRIAAFKALHRGADYPYVLRYSRHSEVTYHYPLQPTTKLETLTRAFDMVRKYDGDFVLSTHYVEFGYPMTYDSKLTMKDVLFQFLDYTNRYKLEKMSLSQMLEKP
jgi:hypothetical protein